MTIRFVLCGTAVVGTTLGIATGVVAPMTGGAAIAAVCVGTILWRASSQQSRAQRADQQAKEKALLHVIEAQKTEDLQFTVQVRDAARRLGDDPLGDRLRVFCDLFDTWTLHSATFAPQDLARSRQGVRAVSQICRRMGEGDLLMSSEKNRDELGKAIRALSRQLAGQLVQVEQYTIAETASERRVA